MSSTLIEKCEKEISRLDIELAIERKRTKPNAFAIQWSEHYRNECFKTLRFILSVA